MTEPLVLIVDDEAGLLTLYTNMISRMGYTVLAASGGAEAIAILEENTPDLLVLDMAMPKVGGSAVLDYIESAPHLAEMRIMVLTALGPGAAQTHDTIARVDQWVNKPVRSAEFQNLIRAMLEGDE